MKLIKIYPLLILLSINLFSYADSKVGLTPKIDEENIYSFNLPKVGKIKVSVHLSECFDTLCDTSLELSWQKDNKTITKKLIEDGYPIISKIQGDENGLVVSSSGNRYNSDEYRNHVRYRYSQDKKTFYSAEIWDTDSLWNPYIKKLDDNLAQGSFAKARALVLKHGTSRNAGHYYESQMFFSKFVDAELREARRAWLDGHTETATHFITALTNKIPFYNHSNSLSKGEAYFFPMQNPDILKATGNNQELFNLLEATDKNNKIIRDLSFYLLEGGESQLALELTTQASRLQPNNYEVWFQLGKANQLQRNTKKAKEAYQHFYSMMSKQKKIAGVPSKVLEILGKHDELTLREKIKKQWLEYKKKNMEYTLEYQGYIGEMPIKMYIAKKKNYDPRITYYDSEQERNVFLQKKKEKNGYFVTEDNGKEEYPIMIWMLKYSFGEPITGWRVLPTGERQKVILSPKSL